MCRALHKAHLTAQGLDGQLDGNPETVIIGAPLGGTSNHVVAVGQTLSDIEGVVLYQCVAKLPTMECTYQPSLSDLGYSISCL